ncbi:MAG: hypothetical protein WAO58_07275 [Fimbriimonadaceae bacterium]
MRRTDLLDTSKAMHRRMVDELRRMSPERRLQQMFEMITAGKHLRQAGERALIVRERRK